MVQAYEEEAKDIKAIEEIVDRETMVAPEEITIDSEEDGYMIQKTDCHYLGTIDKLSLDQLKAFHQTLGDFIYEEIIKIDVEKEINN